MTMRYFRVSLCSWWSYVSIFFNQNWHFQGEKGFFCDWKRTYAKLTHYTWQHSTISQSENLKLFQHKSKCMRGLLFCGLIVFSGPTGNTFDHWSLAPLFLSLGQLLLVHGSPWSLMQVLKTMPSSGWIALMLICMLSHSCPTLCQLDCSSVGFSAHGFSRQCAEVGFHFLQIFLT